MADPGKFCRPLYPPSHAKGPVPDGDDVVAVKRAVARAGFFPWKLEFDDTYNEKISDAVAKFQDANGLDATGNYGKPTHNKLRAANVPSGSPNAGLDVFDDRAAALYRNYLDPDEVPDLGPMFRGGKSVLYQDLTHATTGIPLYPAFDDAFSRRRDDPRAGDDRGHEGELVQSRGRLLRRRALEDPLVVRPPP